MEITLDQLLASREERASFQKELLKIIKDGLL